MESRCSAWQDSGVAGQREAPNFFSGLRELGVAAHNALTTHAFAHSAVELTIPNTTLKHRKTPKTRYPIQPPLLYGGLFSLLISPESDKRES